MVDFAQKNTGGGRQQSRLETAPTSVHSMTNGNQPSGINLSNVIKEFGKSDAVMPT